jgi:excisionase family DNA binding protein
VEGYPDLASALVNALDEGALDALAERLAPRLAARAVREAATTPSDDGWLTTRQAADYLGLTRTALHRHTAERSIPFQQDCPGGKCWFKRSSLDAWRESGGAVSWRDDGG